MIGSSGGNRAQAGIASLRPLTRHPHTCMWKKVAIWVEEPRLDGLELIIGATSWAPSRIFSDVAPLQGIRLKKATLSSNIFSNFFKVRILYSTTNLALNDIYKRGHFLSEDTLKKSLEDLAYMLSRDSCLYELSLYTCIWKIDYSCDILVDAPGVIINFANMQTDWTTLGDDTVTVHISTELRKAKRVTSHHSHDILVLVSFTRVQKVTTILTDHFLLFYLRYVTTETCRLNPSA